VADAASYSAGLPRGEAELAAWDMLPELREAGASEAATSLRPELEGIPIRRRVIPGDPASVIVHTAQEEQSDLILMPSHGSTFARFLLGSVTGKVLHGSECPVWTDAHAQLPLNPAFEVRGVVCAVDFEPDHDRTIRWAADLAAEFQARLTLCHVTAGVELWGPGGRHVDPQFREMLVGPARERLTQLRDRLNVEADLFVGSGELPKVLSQAVVEVGADLLVVGCRPYGGHLRTHGYSILCAVPVPVVSM
jgi:nucleotide-binding universal stress UspA family protein